MYPKPRSYVCIWCGDGLRPDTHGVYICTGCGAEYFPPEATTDRMIRDTLHYVAPCQRSLEVAAGTMHVGSQIGGGSKSSRSRKDRSQMMKKQSLAAINRGLAGSKSPKPRSEYVPGNVKKVGRPKKDIDK